MLQVGWKLEQEQRRSSSCCCCCCCCCGGGGGGGCFVPLEPAPSTNCKSKCQTSTYNISLVVVVVVVVCVYVLGCCFWELINEVSRGGGKNHGSLVWINFIIAKWWSYGFFNLPHSWTSFFVVVLVLWFLACQSWLVTFNGLPSKVLLWSVLRMVPVTDWVISLLFEKTQWPYMHFNLSTGAVDL